MNDSSRTFLDETTKTVIPASRLQNSSTIYSTPQQNGADISTFNTQTVVKKRTRQQTVTVDNGSSTSKEIENIFAQVQTMVGPENQITELQRQIQKLFIQKEREWEYKLMEQVKPVENGEMASCRIELNSANLFLARMEAFTRLLKAKAPQLLAKQLFTANAISSSSSLQNFVVDGNNGDAVGTPQGAAFPLSSPVQIEELVKERNSLREELLQFESSYSDLFKRYEKMRENCVILKNSEEELKSLLEEETTKYERLMSKFHELRNSAAEQLNQANFEIQKILKQHEENTLGLRCRLKMNEKQIQTQTLTISGKDSQINELNKLVEELMEKNGIVDGSDEVYHHDGSLSIVSPGFD